MTVILLGVPSNPSSVHEHNPNHKRKKQQPPIQKHNSPIPSAIKMPLAGMADQDQTPQKGVQRRIRKTHNKVRTGCLTCKIRRKKCDETKPACNRCTSTGRECDGYAVPDTDTSDRSSKDQTLLLPLPPQQTGNSVLLQPRIVELDTDAEIVDEVMNETELSNFILSYKGGIMRDASPSSQRSLMTARSPSPSSSSSSSFLPFHGGVSPRKRHRHDICDVPRSLNLFSGSSSISSIDSSCFSYFREVTGPSFASYFDSSIWRNYTVNAALAHPAVFSAAAALGAVHRRFLYGISREAFEYCAHASRLHAQALKDLEQLKSRSVNKNLIGTSSTGGCGMGVHDRDVIMTCEMLLGLFEGFQSNNETAVAHMNNGMQYLLTRPMTLVHSETQYCAVESKPNTFCRLFHQLHCRALYLFGSPTRILVSWGQGLPLPTIPDIFENLEQARDILFTEVDWIMHAPARIWEDTLERSEAQNLHVLRLLKWSVAYADTVKQMDRTPTQKKACMLMKLTRNATYLLLYLTLFVHVDRELPKMPGVDEEIDDDPAQDSVLAYANKALWEMVQKREYLNTNLARIKVSIESMLDENSIFCYNEHSLSFDSGVGPPRDASKTPEASNKTRHLVKSILRQNAESSNGTDIFEMMGVYGVAERVSALEEHAVISAIRKIIPEHMDPRWVCITCMLESRKILLRYFRPDEFGLGMVWTQEWWAF